MALHFIIDGYNLIKQAPAVIRLGPSHLPQSALTLEDARNGLIRFLAISRPQGKNKVTVVFDGSASLAVNHSCGGPAAIEVIFAKGESADDKIKRMLERSKNPKAVVVVTNDREIRDFARNHRAQIKTVDEFLAKFNSPVSKAGADDKLIRPESAAEINEEMKRIWLK